MVVRIVDLAKSADTAEQGAVVFAQLKSGLAQGKVVVSFEGIQSATSSFVNEALVPLVREFGLTLLKERLQVIQSTRQINEMIKTRLERAAAAA
jgi:hypothetical protein